MFSLLVNQNAKVFLPWPSQMGEYNTNIIAEKNKIQKYYKRKTSRLTH